jgi:hypothetical protein
LVDRCLSAWSGGPADYFMVGLHETDPLLAVVRRRGRAYVTRLFLVCWGDGEPLRRGLDRRTPYLELGAL